MKVCEILKSSSCALPELVRASATNVNKLTNIEYASPFYSTRPELCFVTEERAVGLIGESGQGQKWFQFLVSEMRKT